MKTWRRLADTYYILESTGDIIELDQSFTAQQTYKFNKKHMEFESLVYYR